MKHTRTLAALFIAAALTGCGGSTEPAPEPQESKPADCIAVPQALATQIAKQFTTPITVTASGAVKSPDHEAVHFVTIKGDIDGAPGESYTFAVSGDDLKQPGTILAADSFAQQFTKYPKGDESKAQISTTDPSIEKARRCTN